jgi:hypothetical protein
MAIRLRSYSFAERMNLSIVIRSLIRAGAEKYGLDLDSI